MGETFLGAFVRMGCGRAFAPFAAKKNPSCGQEGFL
jgi:hypothetical protein